MSFRTLVIKTLYGSKLLKILLFNPLVEYHQWKLLRFIRVAASATQPSDSIIDIGAGELKYKPYFSHCNYVSNDLCIGDQNWNYAQIDIVSSAYEIPVDDASFNAALCIQVLEHLDAPHLAFKEFHRILKSGGRLYLSAPLIAGEHQQPFDYFRYTRYGFTQLGEKHGFRVVSITPHGGGPIALETMAWAIFWELLPIRRQTLPRYVLYLLLYPLKVVTGGAALFFDLLDLRKSMTINYDVIYEKL